MRTSVTVIALAGLAASGCVAPPIPDLGTVAFIDIAIEGEPGIDQPRFGRVGRYATQLPQGTGLDIYFPDAAGPFATAMLLPGANTDYRAYTTYAARLAAHGFVVAVPNRRTAFGLLASLDDVPGIRTLLNTASRDTESPLFARVDGSRYALVGHSFGGAAALDAAGGVCRIPFCSGAFDRSELAAVVTYGGNRCADAACSDVAMDTAGIPVQMIQGADDVVAPAADSRATFDGISGGPRQLVSVAGAGHFALLDGTPSAEQTLDQDTSIRTIARWTALFLLSFLDGDETARARLEMVLDDPVTQEFREAE